MMQSFRDAVQNAADRKKAPPHFNGSTRDLARQLGMAFPISVLGLIQTLEGLPPDTVTFNSEVLGPSTVTASAEVGLQSDGKASFRGRIHESGLVGHNYLFAVALLDVVDSQGKTLVFAHQGNVKGQLDIGSSDDEWQVDGQNLLISDKWNIAKNSRFEFRLDVSTDPFQAIETATLGLFIAVGVILITLFVSDDKTECEWFPGPDEDGKRHLVRCKQ